GRGMSHEAPSARRRLWGGILDGRSHVDDQAQRLRKVGTGLALVFYGLCLVVVSVGFFLVGGFLSAASGAMKPPPQLGGVGRQPAFVKGNPFDPDEQARIVQATAHAAGPFVVVFVIGGLLRLAAEVLSLAGRVMCLAVPSDCPGAPIL